MAPLPTGAMIVEAVVDPLPQLTYLRHLVAAGHRRITVTRDRPRLVLGPAVDAELARLAGDGLEVDWCVPSEVMHPNWEQGPRPRRVAVPALARAAARRRSSSATPCSTRCTANCGLAGLACPHDLQPFGDNAADFANAIPRYTTVRVDTAAVGAAARPIHHRSQADLSWRRPSPATAPAWPGWRGCGCAPRRRAPA